MRVRVPTRIDFCGGWTDVSNFCDYSIGRVINIAINKYVYGEKLNKPFSIKYHSDLPEGSGLGNSGAMNVCLVSLINPYLPKEKIAEIAYNFEKQFIICGRQDEYASALGGMNYFEFQKDNVLIEKLSYSEKFFNKLKENLLLFYSGKSRLSGDIHNKVWNVNNFDILKNISEITLKLKFAIENENWKNFYEAINENWKCQKQLDESICPPDISEIENVLKKEVKAFRLTGAGGGGMIQVFTEKNKEEIRQIFKLNNMQEINFEFDFEGIKILEED